MLHSRPSCPIKPGSKLTELLLVDVVWLPYMTFAQHHTDHLALAWWNEEGVLLLSLVGDGGVVYDIATSFGVGHS